MRSCLALALATLLAATARAAEPADDDEEAPERFGIVPFGAVLYAPETSLVFAAAALVHFRLGELEDTRDSKSLIALAYTIENQYLANLQGDVYFDEDRVLVSYELELSQVPGRFYGIGNATSLDDEELYERRSWVALLKPRYRVWEALYVGPAARLKYYDLQERESGGQLEGGGVVGGAGGRDVGWGATALWDTRDGTLNPRRGVFAELDLFHADAGAGSEFSWSSAILDVRGYVSTVERQVLALQGYAELGAGEPPFFMLARFGGSSRMRGHYQGRYRDRNVVVLQGEYRVPVWWRFGVVGFGGVGQVARDIVDLRPAGTHFSLGGGLRFMLERSSRINVRLDGAWGEDDYGIYLGLGEAF